MQCVDNSFLQQFRFYPFCYQARLKPAGRITKTSFPRAKFTSQVFCSFLSAPMCRKSHISQAWELHAIFLSDQNNPL